MILLIDNYDSFTESVSVLLRTGAEVLVSNDALTLEEIAALAPEKIVISPAPARRMRRDFSRLSATMPENAAAGRLSRASGDRPAFGATIVRAARSCMAKPRLSSITAKGCFRAE